MVVVGVRVGVAGGCKVGVVVDCKVLVGVRVGVAGCCKVGVLARVTVGVEKLEVGVARLGVGVVWLPMKVGVVGKGCLGAMDATALGMQ